MTSRTPLAIALVLVVVAGAWFLMGPNNASMTPTDPADYPRGPHGARLLSSDGLQLEVTIFETGVPPQLRVYPYDDTGAPIAPSSVALTVELHRLGDRVDRITFIPESDYLLGQQTVEEPHSFDVKVFAERGGRTTDWSYSSVEGKVQLADAVLTSTGIEIWTVGSRPIATSIELAGQVVADDTRIAHVVPRMAGVVVALDAKAGDRITRGQVLAVVHSRELANARSAYLLATQQTEFARAVARREEALWTKKISAERDFLEATRDAEEAELAETTAAQNLIALGDSVESLKTLASAPPDDLPRYEIRAPIDGVVLERNVTTGESVGTDQPIFVVGDLSSVWVEVPINAVDLGPLRIGQTVRVQAVELDQEAQARVSYLSPQVDVATRRGLVRFTLANPDGQWRPGLFVTVQVVEATTTAAMAVPVEAIQTFRDWQVVFFRYGDWFEARPLELGRTDGVWVEVLSGLTPGDRFAATNSFAIKAEIGKLGATHDH